MTLPGRSRALRTALGIELALFGALGFVPLVGVPGYEHALVSGLILPTLAAIVAALEVSKRPDDEPLDALLQGCWRGFVLATVSLLLALLHALRTGPCGIASGFVYFWLTAGSGTVLGGAYGGWLGLHVRRWKRRRLGAFVLAPLLPLVCIAISVGRFFTSPMVFAFDPFVGYFSGSIYDTVIDAGTSLLTYRVGSFCTLAGLLLLAFAVSPAQRYSPWSRKAARLVGALFLFASGTITWQGEQLGHFETRESTVSALGGFVAGRSCDVVFPEGISTKESVLLARDCDEQLAEVERALGVHIDFRITAFFFRDSAEKRRLMGAADTYIAKPWRREVYLQLETYPHPTLGHELAHVVAGSFGEGPFRIAGDAHGLWPNPGLIEGIAVAASEGDSTLTTDEWARAMLALNLLPHPSTIFSPRFYGSNAETSYTAAGSFVAWTSSTFGDETLRRWYGGTPLPFLTHTTWEALDERYRHSLQAKPALDPDTLDAAQARFAAPGLFARRCPHTVDALRKEATECREAGRLRKALALYERARSEDPHLGVLAIGAAQTEWRNDNRERARHLLHVLLDDTTTPHSVHERAEELLADFDWLEGDFERAGGTYRALAAHVVEEDRGRTLDVKARLTEDPVGRTAARDLLVAGGAASMWSKISALASWANASSSPLADYLIGKNLAANSDCERATPFLERAALHAPTERVARETLRQQAVCACAASNPEAVERVRAAALSPSGPLSHGPTGRKNAVLRLLDRCSP